MDLDNKEEPKPDKTKEEHEYEEESELDEFEEEYIREEEYSDEDERVNWGFGKNEKIFQLNKLRFKPFTTPITDYERYCDACTVTGNLLTQEFLRYLPQKLFRLTYYTNPYQEYHVQAKFLDAIEIEFIDVDASYDLIYHLVENATVMSQIKKITFRNCNIESDLLKLLCPKLEEAYFLSVLDLSHNPIGDEGLKVIVNYLYYWTFLKSLNLFDAQITYLGVDRLAVLYSKQRIFITYLNLGRNRINSSNTVKKLFMSFAKRSAPLEVLMLPNCSLQGQETASHFENFLIASKSLKILDLSFNLFSTAEELLPLAALFANSKNLEVLTLKFNSFNDHVLEEMLNQIFQSPPFPIQKTLGLENMTMPQIYFKEKWKSFNRPDLKILVAGVRKITVPHIDNFKYKLVKRLHFLYKKRKPKKDMVVKIVSEGYTPKQLTRVRSDDFKEALISIGKLDILVVQEIASEFSGGGTRANVKEFIDIYNELYPPKPPKPKKAPKKVDQDNKGHKKKKK